MQHLTGHAHLLRLTPAHRRRRLVQTLAVSAAAAAVVAATGTPAMAAPDGTTTANVVVNSAIALTGLTSSFTLTGAPGATVETATPVTMNVETNNIAGYAVTVVAENDALLPANTTTNPDSIPIAALKVRETGDPTYTSVDATTPFTVHTQATRSASGGDTINNDYSVTIPFVNSDTYSVTLDYLAATL